MIDFQPIRPEDLEKYSPFLQTFFKKYLQFLPYIVGGKDALQWYFLCFSYGLLQSLCAAFHKQFIGILATLAIGHDTAFLFAESSE